MPVCRECPYYRAKTNTCKFDQPREKVKSASRACVYAAAREMSLSIKPGDDILEVGFGVWRGVRRLVWRRGGNWWGVDPKRHYQGRFNSLVGSAAHIPAEDNRFDGCFATETMEHWREHGDEPADGLREINRVLKPGAFLLVTVPMHMHGSPEFIAGDVPKITSYFELSQWNYYLELKEWRRDPAPMPLFKAWHRWDEAAVQKAFEGSTLPPTTWTLSITAWKTGAKRG